MARFDVFNNSGAMAGTTPYLLNVQSDLLDGLDSCMVIPLRRMEQFANIKRPTRLTPALRIGEEDYLLETPKMASVPRRILKTPVTTLAHEQARISAALDFLFQGY